MNFLDILLLFSHSYIHFLPFLLTETLKNFLRIQNEGQISFASKTFIDFLKIKSNNDVNFPPNGEGKQNSDYKIKFEELTKIGSVFIWKFIQNEKS